MEAYLYGSDGKQPGDPHKAALAMIEVVESDDPPLRLLLGADAIGLWEAKQAAIGGESRYNPFTVCAWTTTRHRRRSAGHRSPE